MLFRRLLIAIVVLVAVLEAALRFTGVLKTYSESNYGYFINPFGQEYDSHYWLWPPNEPVTIFNAEFTYEYQTNSIGLVDDELDTANAANTVSLIGDSFTHGQGAPQDSSMPRLFEDLLQRDHPGMYVLNAGIPSGDLYFYSKLAEDVLIPAGYGKFLFVLNTSDLYDYMWLGGRERFNPDGTTHSRKSPWYMGLYIRSHAFRAVFHGILGFDHSYISKKESLALKEACIAGYLEEFEKIRKFMESTGSEFKVIIHPVARHFSSKNKSYVRDYAYLEGMADAMESEGYNVINVREELSDVMNEGNFLQYSWALDKHFNSKGYAQFAEAVYNKLNAEYPEFLEPLEAESAESDSVTTSFQNP